MATSVDTRSLDRELHRTGIIAVSCCALLSFASIAVLASYLAYKTWRQQSGRDGQGSATLNLLLSQFGACYTALIVGDLLQSIGFALSLEWLTDAPTAGAPTSSCTTQAALIQVGDVASALFSLVIALHTAYTVLKGRKPASIAVFGLIMAAIVLNIILVLIGPMGVETAERGRFFDDVGFWCWISSDYQAERLYLHYLWLFISSGGSIILYAVVSFHIRQRGRQLPNSTRDTTAIKRIDRVARKMLLFPLVYTATILPLSIGRIAAMAGTQLSPRYIAIAGSIFALNGFFNTILYSYTRRFVHVSFSKRDIASSDVSREHNPIATTTTAASRSPPRQSFGFLQLSSSSPASMTRPQTGDSVRKSIASAQSVHFGHAIPMGEMRGGKDTGPPANMTTAFAIRLSQASMGDARTMTIAADEEDEVKEGEEVIDDRAARRMV